LKPGDETTIKHTGRDLPDIEVLDKAPYEVEA